MVDLVGVWQQLTESLPVSGWVGGTNGGRPVRALANWEDSLWVSVRGHFGSFYRTLYCVSSQKLYFRKIVLRWVPYDIEIKIITDKITYVTLLLSSSNFKTAITKIKTVKKVLSGLLCDSVFKALLLFLY